MTRRYPPGQVQMLREEMESTGLMDLLDDSETTDVMVNPDGSVWVQSLSRGLERVDRAPLPPETLESVLGLVASLEGAAIHAERPILEATLPFHAARLEALLPPLSTGPVVALRKPPARLLTLDDLVANQTLPRSVAELLGGAVRDRLTCAVAGGVGSGKTTLVNALLDSLLTESPDERLVVLEEGAREIHASGQNVVRLLTSDAAGVGMTELLRAALRLNPSRLLIGETRGREALDFLRAANTGHPGSLLTLHANGARDALTRLDTLAQEAGVPSQLPRVCEALDLVAFVCRDGVSRHLAEVIRVGGLDARGRPETETLYRHDRADGDPRRRPLPFDTPKGDDR